MSNTKCKCAAHCQCECACGADWTPDEVKQLRAQLENANAEIEQLKNALAKMHAAFGGVYYTPREIIGKVEAAQ